jgi:hypothetical protein
MRQVVLLEERRNTRGRQASEGGIRGDEHRAEDRRSYGEEETWKWNGHSCPRSFDRLTDRI